jgi:hypothetical protein
MNINLELTSKEHKDLLSYCKLNNFDPETILKSSYLEGFKIEKYGLLSGSGNVIEKEVIKEVIKYVEVPVVEEKEVVKIEYVDVEKLVEVVKEVPIEKIVEVIKEVPVDRVVEKIVEVTKEVPVERVVIQEVIKEVPIEKVVEKIVKVSDDTQVNELLLKIQQLENQPPKIVETIKEVIKEVPVEVIKEVEIIKEIEVIKEVIVEKETSDNKLKPKLDALQNTVQKLKLDNIEKDKLIKEYEKTIQDIQKFNEGTKAMYLKGSNLDDKLYNK